MNFNDFTKFKTQKINKKYMFFRTLKNIKNKSIHNNTLDLFFHMF